MELSIILAKMVGLYCLVLSISVLLNFQRIPSLVEDFIRDEVMINVSGIIALIIGIIIVVLHPVITFDWRFIITAFGWGAFLIGIVSLLIPELAIKIFNMPVEHRGLFVIFCIVNFACGVVLLKQGFLIDVPIPFEF